MRIVLWLGIVLIMFHKIDSWASDEEKIEGFEPLKVNLSEKIPYEIDFYIYSFLPTQTLLQMRRVNKYWKKLAEDVIQRDHRQVVIFVDKVKLDNSVLNFTLPIYDLKITHFYKGYRDKFAVFMNTFAHKDQVVKLDLSGNRFGQYRLEYIFSWINQFNNTKILDVSLNNITTSMLPLFPKHLGEMTNLCLINTERNLIGNFNNPCWINYLRNTSQLNMVLCSWQQKIKKTRGERKKSHLRKDLENVVLPEDEKVLAKMILSDDGVPVIDVLKKLI